MVTDTKYKSDAGTDSKDEADIEIAKGRRECVKWTDIETSIKVLPEHHAEAVKQIDRHLGYLPEPSMYMPHAHFIRSLIDSYRKGLISEREFNDSVCTHVKHIRNDDMQKGGWMDTMVYTQAEHDRYDTELVQFKEQARSRLAKILKFEPDIEDSLYPEILMRKLFATDWFHRDTPLLPTDYKALTIILYRKGLRLFSKEVADDTALLGF